MSVENIIEHLRMIDNVRQQCHVNKEFKYRGIEHFVLEHGKVWTPAPLTIVPKRRVPKECFANAMHLALEEPGLFYVEGYVLSVIPILHAWCVTQDGVVVDPTIERAAELHYFGVKFGNGYVLDTVLEKETYGILENYEQGFPLLRGEPFDNGDDDETV